MPVDDTGESEMKYDNVEIINESTSDNKEDKFSDYISNMNETNTENTANENTENEYIKSISIDKDNMNVSKDKNFMMNNILNKEPENKINISKLNHENIDENNIENNIENIIESVTDIKNNNNDDSIDIIQPSVEQPSVEQSSDTIQPDKPSTENNSSNLESPDNDLFKKDNTNTDDIFKNNNESSNLDTNKSSEIQSSNLQIDNEIDETSSLANFFQDMQQIVEDKEIKINNKNNNNNNSGFTLFEDALEFDN